MPQQHHEVALTVQVMDGQYHVQSQEGMDASWPGSQDGLFAGEDNWVAVLCGTQWGPVDLRIRTRETAPEEVDRTWDMAAERSLDCSEGRVTIHDVCSNDPPDGVDVAAGWVRLRLSVRERTRAAEHAAPVETAIEQHLLELWPAARREEPGVVHGPDRLARSLLSAE